MHARKRRDSSGHGIEVAKPELIRLVRRGSEAQSKLDIAICAAWTIGRGCRSSTTRDKEGRNDVQ